MDVPESLFLYCCNRCKEPFESKENHYSQGTGNAWASEGQVERTLHCDHCHNIESDVWESEGGFSNFQKDISNLLRRYKDED